MKLSESKNLKWDKMPWVGPSEGMERFHPDQCPLEKTERTDDKFVLYFKNGSRAIIRAQNIEGGREIDLIENKITGFLGRSYEEILKMDVK